MAYKPLASLFSEKKWMTLLKELRIASTDDRIAALKEAGKTVVFTVVDAKILNSLLSPRND
jgi:hypothetical protein